MGFIIQDAHSGGGKLKVDSRGRAHADVVSRSIVEFMNKHGLLFGGSPGPKTLTTANVSGLLHLENLKDDELVIPPKGLSIVFGTATGPLTTGLLMAIEIFKNATTGTLISGATAPDVVLQNQNNASANKEQAGVDHKFFAGAEGTTITNGTLSFYTGITEGRVWKNDQELRIGKGHAVSLRVTPPAGNTSMIVNSSLICYRDKVLATQVEN